MLKIFEVRWISGKNGVAMALAVVLSGCSLINPHVTWDRPQDSSHKTKSSGDIDLHDAIDYAQRAIDEYKAAVGHQAMLTTGLGLGLIPIGGAALGLGITGVSSTAITALGLAGATGYASGTWLSSKDRQAVYLEGVNTMACAIEAVQPLNFSTQQRASLENDLGDLNSKISMVENNVESVKFDAGYASSTEAKKWVGTAEELLSKSGTTYGDGTKLIEALSRAGITLVNAVDRIGAEIDKAIIGTLPNLDSLPGIVGSLSDLSKQFTKLPATAPAAAERSTLEMLSAQATATLKDKLEKLQKSILKLRNAERKVAAVVQGVLETDLTDVLKSCNVTDVATAFTVLPASPIEMSKAKGTSQKLVISGGKIPYTAELLEEPVTGLSVTQPVPGGSRVLIQVTMDMTIGKEYNVFVSDAAGKNQTVKIMFK